jgi:hypothetical protein
MEQRADNSEHIYGQNGGNKRGRGVAMESESSKIKEPNGAED